MAIINSILSFYNTLAKGKYKMFDFIFNLPKCKLVIRKLFLTVIVFSFLQIEALCDEQNDVNIIEPAEQHSLETLLTAIGNYYDCYFTLEYNGDYFKNLSPLQISLT